MKFTSNCVKMVNPTPKPWIILVLITMYSTVWYCESSKEFHVNVCEHTDSQQSEVTLLQKYKICSTHIPIRDRHPLRFNGGSSGYSWGEAILVTGSLLQWQLAIGEIEAMWGGPVSIRRGLSVGSHVHSCYHVCQFRMVIRVRIHSVGCVSTHDCPASVWAA